MNGAHMAMHKPSPDATAGTVSNEGIACDKCNVTFVKSPTNDKGRIVGHTTRKQMVSGL